MSRERAIQAAADALRDQKTPEVWRSFEALAEAAVDAAAPHLTVTDLQPEPDLFGGN